MRDERKPDWNWVEAVGNCTAQAVFRELQQLAKRDVDARNGQLDQETKFELIDINGTEFAVGRQQNMGSRIYFKLTRALNAVQIERGLDDAIVGSYTVGLDSEGHCALFYENTVVTVPHWQVLKAALEPILFG